MDGVYEFVDNPAEIDDSRASHPFKIRWRGYQLHHLDWASFDLRVGALQFPGDEPARSHILVFSGMEPAGRPSKIPRVDEITTPRAHRRPQEDTGTKMGRTVMTST